MLNATDLFNESLYLARNPDVASAVTAGIFSSGFQHFSQFGEFERRNPSVFFDSSYYLNTNPDVATAVANNQLTAFDHFILYGQYEGRSPISLFNNSYYLSQNPDVAAVVQRHELTGIEHYIKFGQFEDRDPSRPFDNSFYLARNPDVAAAVQRDQLTGIEHYLEFGQFEGRQPRTLFKQIYVFGDSLVDDGNLFAASGGSAPQSPPYFNGRFSNGSIWPELLASQLGLTSNPATNFAFGGATTGTTNNTLPLLPGLQTEISLFQSRFPSADPDGLYVIWAGGQDYLGSGIADPTIPVTNLSTAVTKLAATGAESFMVLNLPDLGAIPAIPAGTPNSLGLTALTNAHNSALATALQALDTQNANIDILTLDVSSLFKQIVTNPANFGLVNVTGSVVTGFGTNPTFTDTFLSSGATPNQFLFWDILHPTATGHQLVANFAFSTLLANPPIYPANP